MDMDMDQCTFEQALTAPLPDASLRRLTKRFNYAFRHTRDLDTAMASVNELLEEPLTYRELLAILRD